MVKAKKESRRTTIMLCNGKVSLVVKFFPLEHRFRSSCSRRFTNSTPEKKSRMSSPYVTAFGDANYVFF